MCRASRELARGAIRCEAPPRMKFTLHFGNNTFPDFAAVKDLL